MDKKDYKELGYKTIGIPMYAYELKNGDVIDTGEYIATVLQAHKIHFNKTVVELCIMGETTGLKEVTNEIKFTRLEKL